VYRPIIFLSDGGGPDVARPGVTYPCPIQCLNLGNS